MAGARAMPPTGYEDACELDGAGWPVWLPRPGGGNPCPHDECSGQVELEEVERPMALQCPCCDRAGCDACMPSGRGCECPECGGDDDLW